MASYYQNNHHNHGTSTEIQDHTTNNFHTLILMNPNLADPQQHQQHQHQQPQQPPSHNILLLNSVAAGLSPPQPLLPQHHFVRLPTSPPQPNNVTLYGYPSHEARDIPRARQGLSLSLSSQNPSLVGGSQQPGEDDVAGGQGFVLGSKYLKAAQELLEEVVHVGNDGGAEFKTSSTNNTDGSPKKGNKTTAGELSAEDKEKHNTSGDGGGGSGGSGGQLNTAERQEIQMKKAKLVTMLDEAEQRYRQYNHQMQIVMESFEQAAGMGSAKTYTALALKTISRQFRCLKDAIQGQIRAANKILGDDQEGGLGPSAGGKIEGSRLKYIDHQIRQQRALQHLGMIQNPNAWRPQRGLPERSVSVLRAWLFEHFLHPYPNDSDKIMLAKQTGLTRSQVSNWFINARVRLWKPMIEEMYTEELKEQQQHNNDLSEEKLGSSSKDTSNNNEDNKNINNVGVNIAENHQVNYQNNATAAAAVAAATSSFMGIIPTNPETPFKGNNALTQHQQGFSLTSSLEMEGGISQRSPKRQRNDEVLGYDDSTNNGEIMIKFGNEKQERQDGNGYPIISGGMNFIGGRGGGEEKQGRDNVNVNNNNGYPIISGGMNFIGIGGGGGELGTYPIGEMGRFETEDFTQPPRFLHGNGISLSLGLPPSCENHPQQLENLSATNHSFLSANHQNIQFRRANDFGAMNSPSSHSSAAAFECIDIQNRKGFAAQLLPDFVA